MMPTFKNSSVCASEWDSITLGMGKSGAALGYPSPGAVDADGVALEEGPHLGAWSCAQTHGCSLAPPVVPAHTASFWGCPHTECIGSSLATPMDTSYNHIQRRENCPFVIQGLRKALLSQYPILIPAQIEHLVSQRRGGTAQQRGHISGHPALHPGSVCSGEGWGRGWWCLRASFQDVLLLLHLLHRAESRNTGKPDSLPAPHPPYLAFSIGSARAFPWS